MSPSSEISGQRSYPEQLYLYPHPLTLARDHAEAERVRLADTAAYSSMCATWGRLGGLSTYYRYGPHYYRLLALRRWNKVPAEDLHAAIAQCARVSEGAPPGRAGRVAHDGDDRGEGRAHG